MDPIFHKKIVVNHFGGPEVLTVEDAQTPPPEIGFARLKVLAVGLGYTDIVARRGEYVLAHHLPFTPGYELVGEVLDDNPGPGGERPAWLRPGVRVAVCLPKMAAYTECISLPYSLLVPL